ncbi:MAG: helix-turn-helix domain-containing protein [Calditerrivibrio sp.]|nr:helix-turn-helix domain-containing protein [Calditerrivibrio sp.]
MRIVIKNSFVIFTISILFVVESYSVELVNVTHLKSLSFGKDEVISDCILIKDKLYILDSKGGFIKVFSNYRYTGSIREDLLEALKKTNQNKSLAAEYLNISRSTLYRLIEKYDIDIET